jgi:hypothetical protein
MQVRKIPFIAKVCSGAAAVLEHQLSAEHTRPEEYR